jgi:hypothetical protein
LIEEKAGPNISLPTGVNLRFNKIHEFILNLKFDESFFFCNFFVKIIIDFNFDFFKTKEFNLTCLTEILIKLPNTANFLKKPPYI